MAGPRVTGKDLIAAGFSSGAGPNWYYPSTGYPHVHIIAAGAKDGTGEVTVVSISLATGGQNLAPCPPTPFGDFKFNVDTPGIDWAGKKADFKQRLELLRVVKSC